MAISSSCTIPPLMSYAQDLRYRDSRPTPAPWPRLSDSGVGLQTARLLGQLMPDRAVIATHLLRVDASPRGESARRKRRSLAEIVCGSRRGPSALGSSAAASSAGRERRLQCRDPGRGEVVTRCRASTETRAGCTTRPTGMMAEATGLPTTGVNPAEGRAAMASSGRAR